MGRLIALFTVLRVGESVADPAKWKRRQITATALVPLLLALGELAKFYGINLPLTEADATALAGGFLVVVNLVLTLATSKHVGLPPTNGGGVDEGTAPASPAGPDDSPASTGVDSPELRGSGKTHPVDPFGGEHGA